MALANLDLDLVISYSKTSSPGSAFQKKIFLPSGIVARASPPGIIFSILITVIYYNTEYVILKCGVLCYNMYMSAKDILRSNEKSALSNNHIISKVYGKPGKKGSKKKKGSLGAAAFVTAMIVVFLAFFSSGNLIPSAISERLIEETDVQYADAVESKILVFEQALLSGDVPDNTVAKLKEGGVLVGYIENGNFVEENKAGRALSLKMDNKIISAGEFVNEVHNNVTLYNTFNNATYSRAAYYYDESAQSVLKKYSSRNNFSADSDFDKVMSKIVGSGSDIDINSVSKVQKTRTNSNGQTETYYVYEENGGSASSDKSGATEMVGAVSSKITGTNTQDATLKAAGTLNTADTISKEQKSSALFLAFMENISKMKAGEGNNSNINEAMNYLYETRDSSVVDTKTGEVVTVRGSMLESPSLYAILSGEKIDVGKVENYSSDRILKTTENQLGVNYGSATGETVASSTNGLKGSIGQYNNGGAAASSVVLEKNTLTVSNSLINNDFESIGGISGGELLVEGAVNVGKELAKASGATAGSAESVKAYARLNATILALDAESDRLNRSPFDITSKNTFLGSIFYKLAVGIHKADSVFGKITAFSSVVASTVNNLLPATYADDEAEQYLTNFGDCETLGNIGAVGSASCSMIATFDTTTLNDTFNDAGFINFVNNNTTLSNGVRKIKNNSVLADFIKYNDERITPAGIVDGGILQSLTNESSKIPFVSNILSMVQTLLGTSENNKRVASGAAFVNSSSNIDWNNYKYAQRYVSLARATAALRQYDGDKTAYSNTLFFEGYENPVIAFLNEYYNIANN